ncbi:hypothetical protein, partial [Paenibacillus larvae]|uniref:hypothetical protein n=1 Tax=Paenibacillus larvae TaxID=1464 RepID=UPI0028919439
LVPYTIGKLGIWLSSSSTIHKKEKLKSEIFALVGILAAYGDNKETAADAKKQLRLLKRRKARRGF